MTALIFYRVTIEKNFNYFLDFGQVKLLINVQNWSLKIELTCFYLIEFYWYKTCTICTGIVKFLIILNISQQINISIDYLFSRRNY